MSSTPKKVKVDVSKDPYIIDIREYIVENPITNLRFTELTEKQKRIILLIIKKGILNYLTLMSAKEG